MHLLSHLLGCPGSSSNTCISCTAPLMMQKDYESRKRAANLKMFDGKNVYEFRCKGCLVIQGSRLLGGKIYR